MCDERERLIGFVYDEVDARDRAAVEAHLADCHVCRAEVAGLKAVRQDLLAWDVRNVEPIWRPLAPVAPVPFWRQVPAWAMAAAASLVFATGAAGGLATRLVWPAPAAFIASAPAPTPAPAGVPVPEVMAVPARAAVASVTSEDLAALEARVVARVRAEMLLQAQSAAVRHVPTPVATPSVESLVRQVKALEAWQYDQVALNEQFDRKLWRLGSVTSTLDARMATDADMRMVIPVSFGGNR